MKGETEKAELIKAQWLYERALARSGASSVDGVKNALVGVRSDGIEVCKTSPDTMKLSWAERKKKYLDVMKNEYRGRTARFTRNGHIYYAQFDRSSISKPIYVDSRLSSEGVKALVKAGADGDVFDLVENAQYDRSSPNTKNHTHADYFDYFIKTFRLTAKCLIWSQT